MESKNDSVIRDILKFVAPGTPLREGIDNVLRAKTGGLIVVGYNEKMQGLVDGGFAIGAPFSPAYLYELAKMDGSIILSENGTEIKFANAQLMPDSRIDSFETGMRHRTAERVAKQTGHLVIAISQRRNVITLYKGSIRYALKEMGVILTKANQAIQTLEKYKNELDQGLTNLGALEFEQLVTFTEIVQVMHRVEMVLRIKNEILAYVNELGTEGRLIQLQLTELISNIEEEGGLLIKDYCQDDVVNATIILNKMQETSGTELIDDTSIIKLLGYHPTTSVEEGVTPRGYRILQKIPRLPSSIIKSLIDHFGSLNAIVKASLNDLVKVDGIGEVRANKIKEGLNRIQEQLFVDRHI
ncbi:diadenylate cyclase [Salirhabdus euzebyi]|uniref:DNA integrity scanning protein DisA n=1 Tax=Salirhabdus euzebyi TaxID=394506 RepID=A0A841QA92_9BACI|nr:DNA integrity scanning diadenylate cyclase DisA [Salirhabdus euzebyi]MBB6455213.1 diadenylate cyclase [Salirhabdus euzebyi]